MVEYPQFSDDGKINSLDSIRPDDVPSKSSRVSSLIRDRRFRTAWVVSFFLHIVLFASAMWSPTSAKYRFYGSGTAVSLVGADEIPGGSAKGKSGDKPQDLVKPESSKGKKARKIEVKKKKEVPKKKEVKKKKPKEKPKKVEKIVPKKEPKKKISTKKKLEKKKNVDKKRLARLRKIKERRERKKKWQEKWEKQKDTKVPTAKKDQKAPESSSAGKSDSGAGKDPLAKTVDPPRRKPSVGYPGEGGGDGQGGGSLGGGTGGVARTDVERYYGLIAERIRNFWSIPPNLTDVANLKTEIVVDVARDGTIRNLRVQTKSGNRVYDTAALRAVERSADPTFPPPPNTVKESWIYLGFRFCGRNFCKK